MRETDGGLSNYKLNFTEPLGFEWLLREERTLQSSVFSYFFFQILRILRSLVQINGAALWLITFPVENYETRNSKPADENAKC